MCSFISLTVQKDDWSGLENDYKRLARDRKFAVNHLTEARGERLSDPSLQVEIRYIDRVSDTLISHSIVMGHIKKVG